MGVVADSEVAAKNNYLNKWPYVGAFMLFLLLNSLFMEMLFSDRHEQGIKSQEDLILLAKQSVEQGYKKSATLIFNNIINRSEFQESLYKANTASAQEQHQLRETVYKKLLPVYESMESFRLKQLHFHLNNNDSFLRFHRPLKFGDNLTQVRPTVAFVNRSGQAISGFEEGRIFNGYRFVFPVFWHSKPAGSVETSVSMGTILADMSSELRMRVGFIIRRDIVEEKVFSSEQSNYVQTPFSKDFLYERDQETHHCCERLNRILSGWKKHDAIEKWLDPERIKTVYLKYLEDEYLVTFLPVKNPITYRTVGYIVVHEKHEEYSQMQYEFMLFWTISSLLALILTFLLYNLKRNKKALQVSNKRIQAQNELFAKTQELVHVGTWELNLETNELFWSDEVFRIIGLAPQSFKPTFEKFLSCIHPGDRLKVEEAYHNSLVHKEPYEMEHRVIHALGHEVYVIEECEHVTDEQGKVIRSVGTINDVTLLRRNEQRLRAMKDRYKQLLEDLPIVVYRYQLDSGYQWVFINQAIEHFTGYSSTDLLKKSSKTLFDFIHPKDLHRVKLELAKHSDSTEPFTLEYRICHSDGRMFYVTDQVRKVRGDDDEWMIEGLISDQTEHYESFNKLRKLIDQQPNIVIMSDALNLNFANRAYYEFFGLEKPEDLLENQASSCICEHFISSANYFHLSKMRNDQGNWILALKELPDEKRLVAMKNSLGHERVFKAEISDYDANYYLVSFFDVTQSQLEKQHWQYKASHDPLTGSYNRDFLEVNMGVFLRLVKRDRLQAGVLLIDIDHFKQVNDQFGHAEGDKVLRNMVQLIQNNIRESDIFVRWGGEEFLLLMAVDSELSLEKVAKNIGRLISENIESPGGAITVSIGGAILQDESEFENALNRADAGLYYVKSHGRNGYLFVEQSDSNI